MLKYRLVERKNLSKDAEPDSKLFYPVLDSNGRVSFDDLCSEIAEQGSLTSGDVKNCVDRLIRNTAWHLKEGRSVDMGDIGSFWLALRSSGAATAEDYDPKQLMRQAKVVYRPGKKLREVQESLQFERVASTTDDEEPDVPVEDDEEDLPEVH